MARETRKARMLRIASGMATPDDVSAGMAFVNRLRSAFTWLASLDEGQPLTEPLLDTLLTVKEDTQVAADGCKVAEDLSRAYIIARAEAGDGLFVPDGITSTVYLGLPTHDKKVSVESSVRVTVDSTGMLAAMVRDGLLTEAVAEAYRVAFSTVKPTKSVRFIPVGAEKASAKGVDA